MLHIARIVHKINGSFIRYFGDRAMCESYADSMGPDYVFEIRPARAREIRSYMEEVKARRKSVQFNYDFSFWTQGPAYRASLARLDRELERLREALAAIEARSGKKKKIRAAKGAPCAQIGSGLSKNGKKPLQAA